MDRFAYLIKKTPNPQQLSSVSHLCVDAGLVRIGDVQQDLPRETEALRNNLLELHVLNKCVLPGAELRQRRAARDGGHEAGKGEDCKGRNINVNQARVHARTRKTKPLSLSLS